MNLVKKYVSLGSALALISLPVFAQMPNWEKALHDAAKKEKEFTVYNSQHSTETTANLCQGFERKYQGVKCAYVRTTAQAAYQRFQQDLQAKVAVASVFASSDFGHYPDLKSKKLLQPYKPNNIRNMVDSLKQYNDKDDQYWVGSAGLVIISYNNTVVSEKDAPKKWTDLLDPKWKGKLFISHPGFSGFSGTWAVMMNKLYGWEYFEKLEKNQIQIGRSMNDSITLLNAKERWVAAGSVGPTLQDRDKGNPLSVVYPTDGSVLNVSMMAIPQNAPAPNAAKLYVEFMLDKEAAAIQAKDNVPVIIKGAKPSSGGKTLDQIKVIRPTDDEISEGVPKLKEKFRDTFGV